MPIVIWRSPIDIRVPTNHHMEVKLEEVPQHMSYSLTSRQSETLRVPAVISLNLPLNLKIIYVTFGYGSGNMSQGVSANELTRITEVHLIARKESSVAHFYEKNLNLRSIPTWSDKEYRTPNLESHELTSDCAIILKLMYEFNGVGDSIQITSIRIGVEEIS